MKKKAMALPLALPEVHMFVADVFAETAEELRRIEEVCGIAECARKKSCRLPSAMANGNGKAECPRAFQQGRNFCVLTVKSEGLPPAEY